MKTAVNLQRISAKVAPFIRAMMDSGEYDERDYGMVIDVFQLLPADYVQYIDAEKSDACGINCLIMRRPTTESKSYQICWNSWRAGTKAALRLKNRRNCDKLQGAHSGKDTIYRMGDLK